ncbi:MAG: hypothetical protein MUC28_03710 [Planctomycetes bacterium]|nr:hypothetical protein [Planctomycetota bacterium]
MEFSAAKSHPKIFTWTLKSTGRFSAWAEKRAFWIISAVLAAVSVLSFIYYYQNGLGLAYNDARSHLDIGRRVVEGLNPGLAQIGSVWLPLLHFLMVVSVWNDFMWHSGLAGAVWSMLAYVGTGAVIYLFLRELGVGLWGRFLGVALFALNLNVLYLQSTAMTELVLIFTMTTAVYYLMLWFKYDKLYYLVFCAFWIMLATLVRYDGWFLLMLVTLMIVGRTWFKRGYRPTEGVVIIFCTLAGYGVILWFLWNLLIFDDIFYFIFGPYSAHAQQTQLADAGVLATKFNWWLSFKTYFYALAYNSGAFTLFTGLAGALAIWLNKRLSAAVRYATLALWAPVMFNVLALYLGHSVLYIADLSGASWFNVRYGIMMMPSLAIFIGYLWHYARGIRFVALFLLSFTIFFSFVSADAVTIDDARIGSSQKNVSEVSGWLRQHAADTPGYILMSVASHDAIIFSSGLPMKKFIHEGAGRYYEETIKTPSRFARWIVMRTYSETDTTWLAVKDQPDFSRYELVDHYPFADIYVLKEEYLDGLASGWEIPAK